MSAAGVPATPDRGAHVDAPRSDDSPPPASVWRWCCAAPGTRLRHLALRERLSGKSSSNPLAECAMLRRSSVALPFGRPARAWRCSPTRRSSHNPAIDCSKSLADETCCLAAPLLSWRQALKSCCSAGCSSTPSPSSVQHKKRMVLTPGGPRAARHQANPTPHPSAAAHGQAASSAPLSRRGRCGRALPSPRSAGEERRT